MYHKRYLRYYVSMSRIARHRSVKFVLLLALVATGILLHGSKVSAACAAPGTDFGSVTSTVSIPATGSYRVWSRIQIPNSTNNNYMLEIDGGSCYTVGGNGSLTPNTWIWVDFQSGGSKINHNFTTAGTHTIKMIGTSDGVLLDRVIFTQDLACVPNNTIASDGTAGGNCANPPDITAPTTGITSPVSGTVSGSTTISANATDDSGSITKVEFYIDGVLKGTDNSSPYSYAWDTTTSSNGTHALTTKAYDGATPNNIATSNTVTVTVQNGQATIKALAVGKSPTPQKVGDIVNTFTATITNQGSIAGVPGNIVFKIDNTTIGTVASSASLAVGANRTITLTQNWTATAGSHTLSAMVGSSVYSENFVVASPDTTIPTVSLTAPATGLTVNGMVTISARASDAGGSNVANVAFYVDGALLGNGVLSGTNYNVNWNTTSSSNASHTVSAIATDGAGNKSVASTVTVTVANQVTLRAGDVNGDNRVNGIDLSTVLSNWSRGNGTRAQGNLNGDGVVNGIDLSIVLSNWDK